MTDEQQQIAIAEACGWTNIQPHQMAGTKLAGYKPNEDFFRGIPDYLNDLNAMHEAEKTFTDEQMHDYYIELIHLQERNQHVFHMTARQRAEAFLRTIGKWEG